MGFKGIGRFGRRAGTLAALCVSATLAWGPGLAEAAAGDLLYQNCITGNLAIGPTPGGNGACASNGTLQSSGTTSGFHTMWAVAVSPDGISVYALALNDDAIVRFSRDPATGAITYQGCQTVETESGPVLGGGSGACTTFSTPSSSGTNSAMDTPYGIAISPNGASVYVVAEGSDSIVHFSRTSSTGPLTFVGCISGDTNNGPGMTNVCTNIASATAAGENSGMSKVRSLAVDANGETVYVASPMDDAIARFTRNTGTGAISYDACQTAEEATGPPAGGNNACAALPGISVSGANSGFDNPQALTVSPNGAQLYVASGNDASITRFNRTAGTGVIGHGGCISRETGVPCLLISGATAGGVDSGLENLRDVVVSPNGASLYTIAGNDDSIVQFNRDAGTGILTFVECLTRETNTPGTHCTQVAGATPIGTASGWDFEGNQTRSLAINSAGTGVFFGTRGDDSVVQLDRNTTNGALTYRRCVSAETQSAAVCSLISPAASQGTGTALDVVSGLALSPDGSSLYTTAAISNTVARFGFEPAPVAVNPPVITPTPAKKKCKKGRKLKKGKCVKKKKRKKK